MFRKVSICICVYLSHFLSQAQPPMDSMVNALGQAFLRQAAHIGLSVGIYDGGKKYFFNYGAIAKGSAIAPSEHSIYEIASVTKTFTAYLLSMAVIEKKIHLNDDIRRYLDGSYLNLQYQGHPITIKDLASHTSGLPKNLPDFGSHMDVQQILKQYPEISKAQLLTALGQVRLDFIPGTTFRYSNADAQLIGMILEKEYQLSFADLLRKYITGPLGMEDTRLSLDESESKRLVAGYDGQGNRMPLLSFWRSLPAAGYIKSSSSDMVRFIRFYLNKEDSAVQLSQKPVYFQSDEQNADIALYWFVQKHSGDYVEVFHGGGSFGTTGFCLLIPEYNTGIICLANDAGPGTEQALRELSEKISQWILQHHSAAVKGLAN
jgi:D-alanyl-D-alanine-carboxypeptidase/D-alanyl-D-alanine-endopeptidase